MKYLFAIALMIALSCMTGCASVDQRVNLAYEKIGNFEGGSGDLLIAKPVEKYNAFKIPSGVLVIGKIKDTGREIITSDSISDWLMLAFVQELYTAGYNVKTVSELPPDVVKGITITVSEIKADQVFGTLTVKTDIGIKLSVGVWKNGRLVKTLPIEADKEEEGVSRSAKTVSTMLRQDLRNLMQNLVPSIIKTLEKS
jgi:hypothetical protein